MQTNHQARLNEVKRYYWGILQRELGPLPEQYRNFLVALMLMECEIELVLDHTSQIWEFVFEAPLTHKLLLQIQSIWATDKEDPSQTNLAIANELVNKLAEFQYSLNSSIRSACTLIPTQAESNQQFNFDLLYIPVATVVQGSLIKLGPVHGLLLNEDVPTTPEGIDLAIITNSYLAIIKYIGEELWFDIEKIKLEELPNVPSLAD